MGGSSHQGPHHGFPPGGRLAEPKHYMGPLGDFGGPIQKGIISYSVSSNAQRPMAGMMKSLIFNGARRSSRYWFYWLPSTVGFYYLYKWLKEKYPSQSTFLSFSDRLTSRNQFYNSKAGHAYLARLEAEEEAKSVKQHTKG